MISLFTIQCVVAVSCKSKSLFIFQFCRVIGLHLFRRYFAVHLLPLNSLVTPILFFLQQDIDRVAKIYRLIGEYIVIYGTFHDSTVPLFAVIMHRRHTHICTSCMLFLFQSLVLHRLIRWVDFFAPIFSCSH